MMSNSTYVASCVNHVSDLTSHSGTAVSVDRGHAVVEREFCASWRFLRHARSLKIVHMVTDVWAVRILVPCGGWDVSHVLCRFNLRLRLLEPPYIFGMTAKGEKFPTSAVSSISFLPLLLHLFLPEHQWRQRSEAVPQARLRPCLRVRQARGRTPGIGGLRVFR